MKAIGYENYQGPRLTRQEQLARMHRVIENELTEKQRRAVFRFVRDTDSIAFLRRYWYADSIAEIARRYGMTESKVKMQLSRTKEKLRAYLQKEEIRV